MCVCVCVCQYEVEERVVDRFANVSVYVHRRTATRRHTDTHTHSDTHLAGVGDVLILDVHKVSAGRRERGVLRDGPDALKAPQSVGKDLLTDPKDRDRACARRVVLGGEL